MWIEEEVMKEKTWKEKQAEVVLANKESQRVIDHIVPPIIKPNPVPKPAETRASFKGTNRHSKKRR